MIIDGSYYGDKVDVWSVGCILLELLFGHEKVCGSYIYASGLHFVAVITLHTVYFCPHRFVALRYRCTIAAQSLLNHCTFSSQALPNRSAIA
jgi:serine/threonine protein kinase